METRKVYVSGGSTYVISLPKKWVRKSIRKILDYLIGIEIVEDTNDSMTLEIMVDYKRMSTIQILQRMYSINSSMLLDLGKALKTMDVGLAKDVIVREREIDRLYFLVVRQLKSAVEYPRFQKS